MTLKWVGHVTCTEKGMFINNHFGAKGLTIIIIIIIIIKVTTADNK
jgi:hypothetical protein